MKLIKLRLILDVDYKPNGMTTAELAAHLRTIVTDASSNGFTRGSNAEIQGTYEYKITERKPKRKPISAESKIIINSYPDGRCPDCHCKIHKNVKNGISCPNCGHVFYLPPIN